MKRFWGEMLLCTTISEVTTKMAQDNKQNPWNVPGTRNAIDMPKRCVGLKVLD